jgi:4-hydroxy-tetrahydrodipicolinate synthase
MLRRTQPAPHEGATMSHPQRHTDTLRGTIPAIPTPFDHDGTIDAAALENFCEHQIREGADALVVCGTTGEAPTLTRKEHDMVVRTAVDVAAGRVPVIAGTGSNCTANAIELTRDAEAADADAVLSVVPYYNKPVQRGIHAHFSAIAQSTGLPVLLYDVPSRTACGLAEETILRLAEEPQIVGLKDATGDVARPLRLRAALGPHFRLFSGDDTSAPWFIAHGGDGCISVTSNIAPGLCRNLHLASARGDLAEAQRLSAMIAPLTDALFRETSPTPLKYALSLQNFMTSKVRLPLVEPTEATRREIERALLALRQTDAGAATGDANGREWSRSRVAAE